MENSLFTENKVLNVREISAGKTVLQSKPTALVVTLTTRCDINCLMCEEKAIPWDIPQKTLDEVTGLFPYLEQIIWQGGEVLLLDYFEELLKKAASYPDLHQSLVTNGLRIKETILPYLVKENMELIFSIDGADQSMYERVRRGASWNTLLEKIKKVTDERQRTGPKSFALRMHTVILKSNYRQLESFIDFAHEHSFDAIHLMPIWGNTKSEENIFFRKDREALSFIEKTLPAVREKAKKYGLNLLNSLPETNKEKSKTDDKELPSKKEEKKISKGLLCHMPWKRIVINPAGFVCPACHCRSMAGNVLEESLLEIWNNSKMQDYRKKILTGKAEDLCSDSCIRGFISPDLRGLK
ncbi:MAG TPA: radical SAM protein [bacterium]|nr:radical SAM protein [bacterium]